MDIIKNGYVKKIEWMDIVASLIESATTLIVGWVFSKIFDRLVLGLKKLFHQLVDNYRGNKASHVCPLLDECEKVGENINGPVVLDVDCYGRNSCDGCFERFACRDEKEELKERIQLEAKAQGDEELSDEEANDLADEVINNREMFYKRKKIKAPVILIKSILECLKWEWEEQNRKHFDMGCKSCGARWISDFDDDTCPNCGNFEYTYPIRPKSAVFEFDELNVACTTSQLELSAKRGGCWNKIWSNDLEHGGRRWSILISAMLEPTKKDIRFASGNIALNGDILCSRFFTSKNEVMEFISDFKHYYEA